MSQFLRPDAVMEQLVALLSATLATAYDPAIDVRESSKADFSEDGQLVLKKIAVRVRFGQAYYGQTRDISRTTLSAALNYQIVCRHESLRSGTETRNRSLRLVVAAQAVLAGARLLLPDGTTSDGILVQGIFPVSDQFGPVDECYGVTIEVSGFAQFPGTYSVPGSGIPAPAPGGNA